jgi:hypothetical protein
MFAGIFSTEARTQREPEARKARLRVGAAAKQAELQK